MFSAKFPVQFLAIITKSLSLDEYTDIPFFEKPFYEFYRFTGSKYSQASSWDMLISNTIYEYFELKNLINLEINRNVNGIDAEMDSSSDSSSSSESSFRSKRSSIDYATSDRSKPALICRYRGVTIFKGEEKASVTQMTNAIRDLVNKTTSF